MVPTQVRSVVEVDTLKTNLIYSYTTGINNKRLPLISDALCTGFRAQENSLIFSVFQKETWRAWEVKCCRRDFFETFVSELPNDKEGIYSFFVVFGWINEWFELNYF